MDNSSINFDNLALLIKEKNNFCQKTESIKNGKTPTQFLKDIAVNHNLAKLSKPVSHQENLD